MQKVGEPGNLDPFRALERFTDTIDTFGKVLGARAARDDGVFATIGPEFAQLLAEREAEVLVVGADIGDALGARRIGVEGHDRDAGRGRRFDRLGHGRDVGNGDRKAIHLLGDEVLDDLRFGCRLVLDRALVDALDIAEFLGPLQAAVARHVEERVVHRLGHHGELVFLLGKRRARHDDDGHGSKK